MPDASSIPGPERIQRAVKTKLTATTLAEMGRRLGQSLHDLRQLDAELSAAKAQFKARKEALEAIVGALSQVTTASEGTIMDLPTDCIGKVNPTTWKYDIYLLKAVDGFEQEVFSHSEELPDHLANLQQTGLPFPPGGPGGAGGIGDVPFPEDDEEEPPKKNGSGRGKKS